MILIVRFAFWFAVLFVSICSASVTQKEKEKMEEIAELIMLSLPQPPSEIAGISIKMEWSSEYALYSSTRDVIIDVFFMHDNQSKWDRNYLKELNLIADGVKDYLNSIYSMYERRVFVNSFTRYKTRWDSINYDVFDGLWIYRNCSACGATFEENTELQNETPIDPFLAKFYLSKGTILNDCLMHIDAIKALTAAVKCDPKLVEAYIERAHAYFELGDIDSAIEDYQKVSELKEIPLFRAGVRMQGTVLDLHYHYYTADELILMEYFPDHPADYTGGLCLGVLEGIAEAVETFIPSTLSTISGISQGLWAYVCSPREVTQEIIDTSLAIIDFIRTNTPLEVLQHVVPELRELCLDWDKFDDYWKGRKTGFIIGKYGIDIFGPGVTMKYIKQYRALRRANSLFTIQCCAESYTKRIKIVQECAKRINFRKTFFKNGKIKIHWDKQNKHYPDAHNYQPGKSKVTISREYLEELTTQKAGTGQRARGEMEMFTPGYVERVEFGEIIGEYAAKLENGQVKYISTTKGTIHYAKDSVHVVPSNPEAILP